MIEYQPDAIAPEQLAAKLTGNWIPTATDAARSSTPLSQQNQRLQNQQKERQQQLYRLAIRLLFTGFFLIGHLHHIGDQKSPSFKVLLFTGL
ncbi:MAG UNVERIFIED_CONTAM: hypothetical protein LVR29_07265 [Microcystis novacekii LVE1205-3]